MNYRGQASPSRPLGHTTWQGPGCVHRGPHFGIGGARRVIGGAFPSIGGARAPPNIWKLAPLYLYELFFIKIDMYLPS